MYRRTVLGLASWWSGPLGNNNAEWFPCAVMSEASITTGRKEPGQASPTPYHVRPSQPSGGANEISTATLANKTVANLRSSGLVEIAAPQPVT
ncbi:hypothetical protein MGG_17281 [Pyricularia oryzae 70-15]|uniref:Uncharacterized protein n=2 Tax=Pyricularia oryzae TaxID=318829 RepID=G4NAJ4_PYRO7|nr:uncharacterized protein MGG_17281 [Pyricularia oryzae 70-15]EHA51332.1 hypothetical protein MGG_17281 [Pyricularia oryzae 70-15]ELQ33106.1 hypothetical protein OOU_Y34scaffold01003g25 [Pyricularia oryzae Y34]